jgi:hypothetical protein
MLGSRVRVPPQLFHQGPSPLSVALMALADGAIARSTLHVSAAPPVAVQAEIWTGRSRVDERPAEDLLPPTRARDSQSRLLRERPPHSSLPDHSGRSGGLFFANPTAPCGMRMAWINDLPAAHPTNQH